MKGERVNAWVFVVKYRTFVVLVVVGLVVDYFTLLCYGTQTP